MFTAFFLRCIREGVKTLLVADMSVNEGGVIPLSATKIGVIF